MKFSFIITQVNFISRSHNLTIFIHKFDVGTTFPLLYVDNIIIIRDDIASIHNLKDFLSHQFEIKNLGPLSCSLDLEIFTWSDRYFLSQATYISDLLSHFWLIDNKITPTPLEVNIILTLYDDTPPSWCHSLLPPW